MEKDRGFLVRKATPSDMESLIAMRVDMLREASPLSGPLEVRIADNTRRYLQSGFADGTVACWAALEGDETVGSVCVGYFTLPPNNWCPMGKTAYIGNMFVRPASRGRGVASRLLSVAVEDAKARRCQRILLNSTDAGRPLYQSHGFEDAPTAMALYPFGIDGAGWE